MRFKKDQGHSLFPAKEEDQAWVEAEEWEPAEEEDLVQVQETAEVEAVAEEAEEDKCLNLVHLPGLPYLPYQRRLLTGWEY